VRGLGGTLMIGNHDTSQDSQPGKNRKTAKIKKKKKKEKKKTKKKTNWGGN